MKLDKLTIFSFLALIVIAAVYRIIPDRAPGFAPQIAMAFFGGSVIKDKKWAFALPILSIFISDLLYQGMYSLGWTIIPGFYNGQLTNYILFALITALGFLIRKPSFFNIALMSVVAPTIYFFLSNFAVWFSGVGGLQRPRTFEGLMQAITDGLPFYRNSIVATLFFAGLLFGGYSILKNYVLKPDLANK
ncbi:MAG: hypothetical protein C5B52_18085 [Bacteroidetes bacterium]|nr:MAG: hypothetical protein C5B52_18085 [Bacteroidota bacterium]